MDPYAVLGVARSATRAEIRDAYLRRTKELHPDRLAHASDHERALATRAMQDVTAAYHRLRDQPDAVEARAAHTTTYTPPPTPVVTAPRRKRWLVIGVAAFAVLSGLALSGNGAREPTPDPKRDSDLSNLKGMCITVQPGGRFEDVVDCTRPHDARVVEVVDHGVPCPIWSDQQMEGSEDSLCLDTHQ